MTIVREWSGQVPVTQADGFHEHLLRTGVAEAEATEGFLDSTVLRRDEGDRVRFTLFTHWADEAAVRRFAGDSDSGVARLYPGDKRFGLVPDRHATHHRSVRSRTLSTIRHAYLQAARTAAALLRDPAVAARWEQPSALDLYAVSGLAGHLAGQIFFAENALVEPVSDTGPISILDYYGRVAWITAEHGDEAHVRIRRGSEAQAADGVGVLAARTDAAVARLPQVLAAEPVTRLVRLSSWQWALTLDDFLLSRLMELAVHIDDLAVSVGVATPTLTAEAMEPVLDLLTRLAQREHGDVAMLRALTRRERAPVTIAAF